MSSFGHVLLSIHFHQKSVSYITRCSHLGFQHVFMVVCVLEAISHSHAYSFKHFTLQNSFSGPNHVPKLGSCSHAHSRSHVCTFVALPSFQQLSLHFPSCLLVLIVLFLLMHPHLGSPLVLHTCRNPSLSPVPLQSH